MAATRWAALARSREARLAERRIERRLELAARGEVGGWAIGWALTVAAEFSAIRTLRWSWSVARSGATCRHADSLAIDFATELADFVQ